MNAYGYLINPYYVLALLTAIDNLEINIEALLDGMDAVDKAYDDPLATGLFAHELDNLLYPKGSDNDVTPEFDQPSVHMVSGW